MATLYLRGSLGKYSDDYAFGLRDPVRASADWFETPLHRAYFWRPLHQILTSYLQTLLWDWQIIYHWLNATVHGAVALAVWRLARVLTNSRLGPALAALVFLALPFHFEVTLWCTSVVIAIATLLWLVLALWYVRFAQGRVGSGSLGWMCLLAFAIPCFYEQPGAAIPALGLLYLATCPAAESGPRRAWRAAWSTGCLALTQVVYVALLVSTSPPDKRGGSQSLISPSQLPDRAADVAIGFRNLCRYRFSDLLAGAVEEGLRALASPFSIAPIVLVSLAGASWVWRSVVRSRPPAPEAAASSIAARPGWVLAFVGAVGLLPWLPPMLLRNQIVEARMTYIGGIGGALLLAVILEHVFRLSDRLRVGFACRLAVSAGVVGACIYLAIACVGMQVLFRARSHADEGQAAQLADLVPNAPPHTVFVCLGDDFRPARTGRRLFDGGLLGWLNTSWTCSPVLREAMRRRDVHVTHFTSWSGRSVDAFTPYGLRSVTAPFRTRPRNLFPPHHAGGIQLGWWEVVPFVVNADGSVALVDRIIVENADGTRLEISPPLAGAAVRARGISGTTITIKQ